MAPLSESERNLTGSRNTIPVLFGDLTQNTSR